jgi:membrane protease YdiL (CAAX protease family)
MILKPSRLIPIASAVLLLIAGTLWAFASGRVPGLFIAGLWAAALVMAAAPLVLSLIDFAKKCKRSNRPSGGTLRSSEDGKHQ